MSQNFSTELKRFATLQDLNDNKAKIYYGGIMFLAVLILPGVIGNLHVLFIYIFKKPQNNTKIFVCFLAVIDMVSCTICFPFNIVTCLYPLMYYDNVSCKIFNFLNSFVLIGSALSLLVIAIERYRKICRPFLPQITLKHAKMLCGLVLTLTVLFSTPILHLYGSTEIATKHPNITGFECYVQAELQDTAFQMIHGGFILVVSLGCCSSLTVLYILIGIQIWQQQAKMRNKKILSTSIGQNSDRVPVKETYHLEKKHIKTVTDGCVSSTMELDLQTEDSNQPESSEQETSFTLSSNKSKQKHGKQKLVDRKKELDKFNQMKKTTYMFIWITLFYILSYIPYPILRLYQIFNKDWYNSLSHSDLVIFHFALTTLFLNNVVNSFIYMICDSSYRRELISFYSRIFCRK